MAVFKVTLAGRWSEDEGWVKLAELPAESGTPEDGSESAEEEGMED